MIPLGCYYCNLIFKPKNGLTKKNTLADDSKIKYETLYDWYCAILWSNYEHPCRKKTEYKFWGKSDWWSQNTRSMSSNIFKMRLNTQIGPCFLYPPKGTKLLMSPSWFYKVGENSKILSNICLNLSDHDQMNLQILILRKAVVLVQ